MNQKQQQAFATTLATSIAQAMAGTQNPAKGMSFVQEEAKPAKQTAKLKLTLKEGLSKGGRYRYEVKADTFTVAVWADTKLAKNSSITGEV